MNSIGPLEELHCMEEPGARVTVAFAELGTMSFIKQVCTVARPAVRSEAAA
jgi:hypothetical protein